MVPSSAGQFTIDIVEALLGEAVTLDAVNVDVVDDVDERMLVESADVVEALVKVVTSDMDPPLTRDPAVERVGGADVVSSTKEPFIEVKFGGYVVTVTTLSEQASIACVQSQCHLDHKNGYSRTRAALRPGNRGKCPSEHEKVSYFHVE